MGRRECAAARPAAARFPPSNPQTPGKIALGEKLFDDKRFSSHGRGEPARPATIRKKAFTDSPLVDLRGINKLTGTRNAPTVVNAAYFTLFFWDGRSADLEDQAQHPFLNPVEMGLPNHDPVLKIVRTDPAYVAGVPQVFGKSGRADHDEGGQQAIASFERTISAATRRSTAGTSAASRMRSASQRSAASTCS